MFNLKLKSLAHLEHVLTAFNLEFQLFFSITRTFFLTEDQNSFGNKILLAYFISQNLKFCKIARPLCGSVSLARDNLRGSSGNFKHKNRAIVC